MVNKARRSFIFTASTLSALAALEVFTPIGRLQAIQDKRMQLLSRYMLDNWMKIEDMSPSDYLEKKKITMLTTANEIKAYIENDFQKEDIIVVNGFMLSKTETAILAHIDNIKS